MCGCRMRPFLTPRPGKAGFRAAEARSHVCFRHPSRHSPHRPRRGGHAKLLANAAARRLRAAERIAAHRDADADYWKAACPMVVAKAAALREERSFSPLP